MNSKKLIEILKWYADEYVSSASFSSHGKDLMEDSARRAFCYMVIGSLQKKEYDRLKEKTFCRIIGEAIIQYINHHENDCESKLF